MEKTDFPPWPLLHIHVSHLNVLPGSQDIQWCGIILSIEISRNTMPRIKPLTVSSVFCCDDSDRNHGDKTCYWQPKGYSTTNTVQGRCWHRQWKSPAGYFVSSKLKLWKYKEFHNLRLLILWLSIALLVTVIPAAIGLRGVQEKLQVILQCFSCLTDTKSVFYESFVTASTESPTYCLIQGPQQKRQSGNSKIY